MDRPRGARQEEKGSDAKLTQNGGDSGGIVRGEGIKLGVERGTNGTAYRLGGMSQEERQEMLDLREQVNTQSFEMKDGTRHITCGTRCTVAHACHLATFGRAFVFTKAFRCADGSPAFGFGCR